MHLNKNISHNTWDLCEPTNPEVVDAVDDEDPAGACQYGDARALVAVEDPHIHHLYILGFL